MENKEIHLEEVENNEINEIDEFENLNDVENESSEEQNNCDLKDSYKVKGFRIQLSTIEEIEKLQKKRSELSTDAFIKTLIDSYQQVYEGESREVLSGFMLNTPEGQELKTIFERANEIYANMYSSNNLKVTTLVNKHNADIEKMKEENEHYKDEISTLNEAHLKEIEELNNKHANEKNELKSKLTTTENDYLKIEKKQSEIEKDLKNANDAAMDLERSVNKYKEQCDVNADEIKEKNEQIGKLNNEITQYIKEISEKDKKINELDKKVNLLESKNKELETFKKLELDAKDKEIKLLNDQINFYKNK